MNPDPAGRSRSPGPKNPKSSPCTVHTSGGNALFFRWLLLLCYIINIWSYLSHLHHMPLRGSSEKVLISQFVEPVVPLLVFFR